MTKLSHIGLKVKDLDKSVKFYQNLIDCESLKIYDDKNFRAVLMKCKGNTIELIQDSESPGKRDGVIEHIAFKVEDIKEEIRKLKSKGVECISEGIQEFEGVKLFFFRGPDGEMLEFIE